MLTPIFTVLALTAVAVSAQESTTSVSQAFSTAKLVPDVLPSFNPDGLLDVVYTDNTTNSTVMVAPGQQLQVDETSIRPQVSLTSDNTTLANETFVLIMVDPDAPTPQNTSLSQIRHLLAGSLRPNGSLAQGAVLVNSTPAVSEYIQPSPPAGSDPHRYTLLLYVQPAGFEASISQFVNASTPISGFNVSVFARELGLGSPIAGNFFTAGPASNSRSNSTSTSSSGEAAATQTQPSSGLASAATNKIRICFVVALAFISLI